MAIASGTRRQRPETSTSRKSRPAKGELGTQVHAEGHAQPFWQPGQGEVAQRTYGNRALAASIERNTDSASSTDPPHTENTRHNSVDSPSLERSETPPASLNNRLPGLVSTSVPAATLSRTFDNPPQFGTDDIFFRSSAKEPPLPATQWAAGAIQRSVDSGVIQREIMSVRSFKEWTKRPFGMKYTRSEESIRHRNDVLDILGSYHDYCKETSGSPPYRDILRVKSQILHDLAKALILYKASSNRDKVTGRTKTEIDNLTRQVAEEQVRLGESPIVPDPRRENRGQQAQPIPSMGMTVPATDNLQFGAKMSEKKRQRLGLGNQGNAPGNNAPPPPPPQPQQQGIPQAPQQGQQQNGFFLDLEEVGFYDEMNERSTTFGGMKRRRGR